jgi:histone-lysine N-methyltransferase SETMAR
MANLTQATLATMGWEIMNQPPYSPDLTPSDFHLFGPMKARLEVTDDELKQCPELATQPG